MPKCSVVEHRRFNRQPFYGFTRLPLTSTLGKLKFPDLSWEETRSLPAGDEGAALPESP